MVALLSLGVAAQQPAAPAPAAAPTAVKTAEQQYQNIQVFKGLPASELRSTMQFFADSLGVQCTFCHAFPFSADVKPQKATARRMVQMVFDINKTAFNGRPQVTCYTCHRGSERPSSQLDVAAVLTAPPRFTPPAAEAAAPPRRRGPGDAPSAQAIFDKYVQALGGASALAAIHSEIITASHVTAGSSVDETVTRAGANFIVSDGAESKSGYSDGAYFTWNPRFGKGEAEGEALTQLRADAGMYPAAGAELSRARVFGPVNQDKQSVYVVIVPGENGANTRYTFDATSGLLLRLNTGTATFIGPLPLEIDYSDYRAAADGVTLPYDVTFATHEQKWERKVSSIQINPSVAADAFTLPAGTGRRGGPAAPAPGRGPVAPPPAP